MFPLTKSKHKALSSVSANFSTVFLASLVIPIFTGEFDINNWPVVLFGLITSISLIWLSVLFAEKGKL